MGLYIRMVLYAVCAGLAGYGLATFDPAAGTITIQVDELAKIIGGGLGYLATFYAGRVAKSKGGAT